MGTPRFTAEQLEILAVGARKIGYLIALEHANEARKTRVHT
jgi:hypothetical protein